MKTKVFELGAISAAVALLLVLSSPVYAKSGGSSGAQTRVSKTPSNTTSVKPVTSPKKKPSVETQSRPDFADGDRSQLNSIVMHSASRNNNADTKAAMQQMKASKERSRTYKPY